MYIIILILIHAEYSRIRRCNLSNDLRNHSYNDPLKEIYLQKFNVCKTNNTNAFAKFTFLIQTIFIHEIEHGRRYQRDEPEGRD